MVLMRLVEDGQFVGGCAFGDLAPGQASDDR